MSKLAIVLVPLFILALTLGTIACGDGEEQPAPTHAPTHSPTPADEEEDMELSLSSPAFQERDRMPAKYTCQGQDVSPPLVWTEPPVGTRSLALMVDDPDAPGGVFTHWVLFNVPSETRELAEGQLPGGALQGRNDFGVIGYRGPCPPPGPSHRYQFTLYALDQSLESGAGASKGQVLDAMQGHILAQCQLTGTYQR